MRLSALLLALSLSACSSDPVDVPADHTIDVGTDAVATADTGAADIGSAIDAGGDTGAGAERDVVDRGEHIGLDARDVLALDVSAAIDAGVDAGVDVGADAGPCGRCVGPQVTEATCLVPDGSPPRCVVGRCEPDFRDCNARIDDGCEANIRSDRARCGGCAPCGPGEVCMNFGCVAPDASVGSRVSCYAVDVRCAMNADCDVACQAPRGDDVRWCCRGSACRGSTAGNCPGP